MRLSTAVAAAAYLGLFAVDAFVAPAPFRPSGIARSMSDDRGWDNDNFLDALGGGDDAIDEANAKYDHEADVRRDRMGQASERDGNPNGDILKKMLGDRKPLKERVQPARSVPPPPPPPPPLPQMQAPPQLFDKDGNPVAVAPPQTPTYYDQNGNPVQPPPQFYYDQNGNPIPSYAPPPQGYAPPPPVPQQTNQPKRNPDADRIINKADVYLAQLKVDSTTRVMARARGDIDASNEVFTNPKINQLEEEVLKNPYLDEEKDAIWDLIETSEDEVLSPFIYGQEEERRNSKGPNYKEKMAALKAKKKGNAAPDPAPEPVAVAPAAPTPAAVSKLEVAPAPKSVDTSVPPAVAPDTAAVTNSEELRRDIRTLMGLVLKHRGGPGFGSGILKDAEAQRLKNLLADVKGTLREEAGMKKAAPTAEVTKGVEPASPPTIPEVPPSIESTGGGPSSLAGAIACVEGAVQMYKAAAPSEQKILLPSLRTALLGAVNTCNKVIADAEVKEAAEAAAVESPVEPFAPASGGMAFPSTYAVTQPEEAEETLAPEPSLSYSTQGDDANTAQLRQVYDKLKASQGDEKFGLKGLSETEISTLGETLLDMRGILMDELDGNVPSAPSKASSPASSSDDASTASQSGSDFSAPTSQVSKYQQMLAASKAEKAKKKN